LLTFVPGAYENVTVTDSEAPGARDEPLTVRYGLPPQVPVGFDTVTPAER